MSTLALHRGSHKFSIKAIVFAILFAIVALTFASQISFRHTCDDDGTENVRETFVIPATYILIQTISNREKCQYHDCWYIKVPGYNYCSKHLKKKMKRSR